MLSLRSYKKGARTTSALIDLLGLALIQTSWPSTGAERYAIAMPIPPRLGEGAPLVTYPIMRASSESESITGCPGRGDGPLATHLIAVHFCEFSSDRRTLSFPMNSWSILRPKGTAVSAESLERNPSGRFESANSPRPGQWKSWPDNR